MGPHSFNPLSRSSPATWLGTVLLLLGIGAALPGHGEVLAQTPSSPLPPDTIAPDTLPPDTIGADTLRIEDDTPELLADTVAIEPLDPVVVAAPFRGGESPAWTTGVWEWDRDELLRSSALTLTDLLEEIPGLTPIRSGFVGHPEAVAIPGGLGGSLEIYLDGFALDPLDGGTYDLSRLELVELERVRVERRGGGLRVELETIAPTDHRPYSMVEAGTGEYGARMFRGTFMTPHFILGPLALGIERLEGSGIGSAEPASTFTSWLKWTRGVGPATLQFEWRRSDVEWERHDQLSMQAERNDWVFRARSELAPNLTADAFFGSSSIDDTSGERIVSRSGLQGGIRALYQSDRLWTTGTLRGREASFLPRLEAELAGALSIPGGLDIGGDIRQLSWRDHGDAVAWSTRLEIGTLPWLRPFAEISSGERGIPGQWEFDHLLDPEEDEDILRDDRIYPAFTEQDATRAGVEFNWRGARLGVAWNRITVDSVADFGLPFDRTGILLPGGTNEGIEVSGAIPLGWEALQLQGWYTQWRKGGRWPYHPQTSLKTALTYHQLPLPSGNLEISARLEFSHRAGILVPVPASSESGGTVTLTPVPALSSLDFYLQIRVLDLRAFVRWNNITHRLDQQDLPGRIFPGQRAFYGVKWQFWN